MSSLSRQSEDLAQASRTVALRTYIEECISNRHLAQDEGDDERVAWWAEEELGARRALIEAEAA